MEDLMGPRGVLVGRLWTIQAIFINPESKVRFLKYPCLNSLHCVIGLLHCVIGLVCLILDCHLNLNSNQEQYLELLN